MNQPSQAGKRIWNKEDYVRRMEASFRRMAFGCWLASGVTGGLSAYCLVYTVRQFLHTNFLWTCLRIALGLMLIVFAFVQAEMGKTIGKAAKNGWAEQLWTEAHLPDPETLGRARSQNRRLRLYEAWQVGRGKK